MSVSWLNSRSILMARLISIVPSNVKVSSGANIANSMAALPCLSYASLARTNLCGPVGG